LNGRQDAPIAERGASRAIRRQGKVTRCRRALDAPTSPSGPGLGWRETVRTQRTRLATDLTPSLRRSLADELPDLYARARHDAEASLRDHGEHAASDALPAACPYVPDQIIGDWLP